MKDIENKIILGITGDEDTHHIEKIEEIIKNKIECVSLFLQYLPVKKREKIYNKIENSTIKEIPLVHIGKDVEKKELSFLFKKYKTRFFTIHESDFNILSKWKGFYKYLFLEMSTDNIVAKNVKVERIGGFCVDLAHYQKQKDRRTIDYQYVYERRKEKSLFKCNHLSGYSSKEMTDLHYVESEKDFDFLKNVPDFVFGKVIAIEVNNSISDQLRFKDYIINLLSK
jgi:predicted hydrolase (HD superfamily)